MAEIRRMTRPAKALAAVLLAVMILAAAPGCKNAAKMFKPKDKPVVEKPAPWFQKPFVAYYRQGADSGVLEIWRMAPDGADQALLTTVKNPRGYSLADLGPTVSIMAWDPVNFRLFYTYEKKLFRYDINLKTDELVAEMISLPNKGIDWMWFSNDYKKILAHVAGAPSPQMYKNEEYVQVSLSTGSQGKVSPEDAAWDTYDFFNSADFFIIHIKNEDTTYAAPQGGAYFTFEPGQGAGGWPVLAVVGRGGARTAVTDGSQRVLSARWTPSAGALAFVPGETCQAFCRGRIFSADPATGAAAPVSQGMFRFDVLLNMSTDSDAIVYGEPGAGVMRYAFDGAPPRVLDPDGANPFLFGAK
jgi:hypothetical protein